MNGGALKWYEILSLPLFVWAAASRLLPRAVPVSPFPLCLGAAAFAVPYHALVLGSTASHTLLSGLAHIGAAAAAPFDVSGAAIAANAIVFAAHALAFDFVRVYAEKIPRLHREVPLAGDRMISLFS